MLIFRHYFHTTTQILAGHSKWQNIRHIKALNDGKKAIVFAKYSRQIRLAIQEGKSPNPSMNSHLKSVIDVALKNSMPQANIQTVIKKYSSPTAELRQIILEMKILNKISAVAIVYTDNTIHTKQAISTVLRKTNGAYSDCRRLFEEIGLIEAIPPMTTSSSSGSVEQLLEQCTDDAIECGAEDVEVLDEKERLMIFKCAPEYLDAVKKKFISKGYSMENASHLFLPKATISVSNAEDQKAFAVFLEKIKAVEGVEDVFHNLEDEIE